MVMSKQKALDRYLRGFQRGSTKWKNVLINESITPMSKAVAQKEKYATNIGLSKDKWSNGLLKVTKEDYDYKVQQGFNRIINYGLSDITKYSHYLDYAISLEQVRSEIQTHIFATWNYHIVNDALPISEKLSNILATSVIQNLIKNKILFSNRTVISEIINKVILNFMNELTPNSNNTLIDDFRISELVDFDLTTNQISKPNTTSLTYSICKIHNFKFDNNLSFFGNTFWNHYDIDLIPYRIGIENKNRESLPRLCFIDSFQVRIHRSDGTTFTLTRNSSLDKMGLYTLNDKLYFLNKNASIFIENYNVDSKIGLIFSLKGGEGYIRNISDEV